MEVDKNPPHLLIKYKKAQFLNYQTLKKTLKIAKDHHPLVFVNGRQFKNLADLEIDKSNIRDMEFVKIDSIPGPGFIKVNTKSTPKSRL